jgi:hypothetical protein
LAKKFKYDLDYLYNAYKKNYNRGNMEKANVYNGMAAKLHGVHLDVIYHEKLSRREDRLGPFGIGKTKKLKYG